MNRNLRNSKVLFTTEYMDVRNHFALHDIHVLQRER